MGRVIGYIWIRQEIDCRNICYTFTGITQLTMAITMTTELAHSQGSVWQGISLTAETRRRMLTRIMTVEMEKRQMSRLEMMFPSLTPPMSSDEVLRYLQDKA